MGFDDLKEQLREKFATISSSVQESAAWIELSEKFQNLSPSAQKAVLGGVTALLCLVLLAFPWMFFSSSQDLVAEFEEKRQLIREAFQVSRDTKTLPPVPGVPGNLTALARSRLDSARLTPDQIASVTALQLSGVQPGIPKALDTDAVLVNLNKLNLKQIVDIGHEFQSMHGSVKVAGLDVRANNEDDHYFDVSFKLIATTVPPEPAPNAKKEK